ncbi:MAG: 3-dehydroquinate synthase [Acidimicrobiales bacterium]
MTSAVVTIDVAIPGVGYPVIVGPDLLAAIDELLGGRLPRGAERVAVVSSGVPAHRYAPVVAEGLERVGLEVRLVELPDGEAHKTVATLDRCCRAFARIPLGRNDLVVAVGGGVIGDLAGFAAAIWNRGVPVVQVPTTLLGQVDAAIGGKTAVDLPEGKNLLGAFHQPLAVVADTATLATLPERQRRAGLAEVAKYGFVAAPEILTILEDDPGAAVAGKPELLFDLVRRSIGVKAGVVATDERETGQRTILNYGHTVGHAIEALGSYSTSLHGEAVALGMVFAARLGERLGVSEPGLAARTVRVLDGLGLPTGGVELDPRSVWKLLRRDKKAHHGVRFVLCPRPGDAVVVDQPDPAVVDEVLASLTD